MPAAASGFAEEARHAGRAIGGALLFSLPILTTMEMWWHGITIPPVRLALFIALSIPMLIMLAKYFGTDTDTGWRNHIVDAFVGLAIGTLVSISMLGLFGLLTELRTPAEWVGRIMIQAIPAAIGALLTVSQFSLEQSDEHEETLDRPGRLFLMLVGALFIGLSLAGIEEIGLIARGMQPWQLVGLFVISLLISEVFLVDEELIEQRRRHGHSFFMGLFLHATVAYALALLVAAYLLWTFGQFDHRHLSESVTLTVVLGFATSIGAAASRVLFFDGPDIPDAAATGAAA